MNTKNVIGFLKDLIQDNLKDPLSQRTGFWVFDSGLKVDLAKNSIPKIHIQEQETIKERLAVGETKSINTARIEIMTKAHMGRKYAYDGQEMSGTDLAYEIISKIQELIEENHSYFVDKEILHVIPTANNRRSDLERNPIYVLTIEAKYIN